MPSLEDICVNDLRMALGLPSRNVRALSESNYSSPGSLRFIRFSETVRKGMESRGLSNRLVEAFFGILPIVLRAAAREEGWIGKSPQALQDLERYLALVPSEFSHSILQPHRIAMKLVEKALVRDLSLPSPFLELGIGDGHASSFLFEGRRDAVGGEARLYSLRMAKRFPAHERLLALDMQQIPFSEATFSSVSVIQALNRVGNRKKAIAEMSRVLKPGGTLLITDASEFFSSMHSLYNLLKRLGFGLVAEGFSEIYWNYSGQNPDRGADPAFYRSALEELGFDNIHVRYFMSEQLTLISYLYFPFICLMFQQPWAAIHQALLDPENAPLKAVFVEFLREVIVPLVEMDSDLCQQEGRGSELIVVAQKRGKLGQTTSEDILDRLACPECRRGLSRERVGYRCTACELVFPIVDGFPLLIPFYAKEYEYIIRDGARESNQRES
jgi:ubiquinone/menaquinone biosynthesis C-methylase UbiE/uncharacterized protein YbaR (Trm112 family)